MPEEPQKSLPELHEGMSEMQRRIIAEGIATMHRFATEPALKNGKAKYKANTVESIVHLKAKRGS